MMRFFNTLSLLSLFLFFAVACSNGTTLIPNDPEAFNSENIRNIDDPNSDDGLIQRVNDPLNDSEDLIDEEKEIDPEDIENVDEMKEHPSYGKEVVDGELYDDELEAFECRHGNKIGVYVCHFANSKTMCKSGGALKAHLGHSDTLGPCSEDE